MTTSPRALFSLVLFNSVTLLLVLPTTSVDVIELIEEQADISCKNCESFYDGCNFCECSDNGLAACTRRGCQVYEDARCIVPKEEEEEEEEISCQVCRFGFFDGCNECRCEYSSDEKSYPREPVCTELFCPLDAVEKPRCLADPQEISCENCPFGYWDGCNTCGCDPETGFEICTLRACSPDELSDPVCNRPTCDICPRGFNDGCNECICAGSEEICTDRACEPYQLEIPFCFDPVPSEEPTESPTEDDDGDDVISCKNCRNFFDGCNACTCDPETGLEICTLRFCEDDELTEPICYDPIEEFTCDTCREWFDGCNNCFCDNDGNSACTEKFCEPDSLEKPFCIKPVKISCDFCQHFFDGCNTCRCGQIDDDGVYQMACTKKYCEPYQYEEPVCLSLYRE